jgi:hypothetical protein
MAINIGSVTIGNLWKSQTELFNLVISHLNRYPAMEVQDVYTLFYQGAMGPDRYAEDHPTFTERLTKEYEETDPNENQALWETIRPDGELVRVFISALKALRGSLQTFSTVCLWTASIFVGDKEDLVNGWDTFKQICYDNRLRKFTESDISAITIWAEENNYPSMRHSSTYREKYHPHYRLLRRDFLNILMEQT